MEPDFASTLNQPELFHHAMRYSESERPVTRRNQLTFALMSTSTALEVNTVLLSSVRRPSIKDLLGQLWPV